MISSVLVFVCGLAVIGLVFAERHENAALRQVFKPIASLAFVAAAITAGAGESAMGQIILAGLVLSALGDIFLIARSERLFLMGMAAFGLGHLAYSSAFLIGSIQFGYAAASAAGLTLAAGLYFLRPMRSGMGGLSGPVAVYTLIISAMVGLSVGHHVATGSAESLRLAIGAAAFAASDLAVARDRFLKPEFLNRAWGLPLYYGAQCLIATAV